jgi:hypothetical protein
MTKMSKTSWSRKYTPAVPRYWLLLFAGLLWSGVGTGLCIAACYWLSHVDWPKSAVSAAIGIVSGIFAYRFGFSTIAKQNIRRITQQPERVCVFAFQAWRSYLLIIIMLLLGFELRQSHLSRLLLSIVYLTVGIGLALSSSLYYEELV